MARRKSHRRSRRRGASRRRRRVAVASVRRRRNPRRSIRRTRSRSRSRRRSVARRRNPPRFLRGLGGGGRGIVGQVTTGLVDAALLLGGEAGTNIVAGFIPLDKSGVMGMAVKVAAAVAVSYVAGRFVGPNARKMTLAGGLASVIRAPIKNLNLPIVSGALGDLYDESGYAVGAGAYPSLPGVGAYPSGLGQEDVTDEEAYQYGQ